MTTQTIASSADKLALHGGTPVAPNKIPIIAVEITDADVEAATAVLRSGMLAMGKNCKDFEARFGELTAAKHALTCANGTCALQLAYEPLIAPGDEVLVPAWGYIATVTMVLARGATPVFVDADPETYNFDPKDAASKITSKTTAIVATHLYGNPVDIDGIEALASAHGLSVIFDAAQSHLATYKGRGIGAFGDASTYSFYATKNMTTGEGGMVTTNDADLAERVRLLRSHGEVAKYTHDRVGYNYRMSDVEAALGLSQLGRIEAVTKRRQEIASQLSKAIDQIDGLFAPRATESAEHVYHLYQVRLDADKFRNPAPNEHRALRDAFAAAMISEGISTAIHYPRAVTHQPLFDQDSVQHQPVADALAEKLFCVPVHHKLTDEQVTQIADALAKVATGLRA